MASTKHSSIEYRLLVQHSYDDIQKKHGVLFLLETSKQFTNFSYGIDVRDAIDGKELHWTLHGLRAPSMNMPETGTAQYSKVYFDLPKTVRFTLVKKEKIRSSAEIKIGKTAIAATAPDDAFLKIYTDNEEFENNRLSDSRPPEYKPDIHRVSSVGRQKIKKKKD